MLKRNQLPQARMSFSLRGLSLVHAGQAERHVAILVACLPGAARQLDLLLSACDELGGQHDDDVVNGTHAHTGVAAHRRVHGVVGETRAVDVVIGRDRHRTDDVRRINIEGAPALRLEVRVELVAEEGTDVTVLGMAGRVELARRNVLLPSALGDGDDHVALLGNHLVDVGVDVLQLDAHLGDEAQVDQVGGERRVARHEAGVAAHQLHDTDALVAARRFDPRVADYIRSGRDGRVEAEGAVKEEHVVVDGLRHADNGDGDLLHLERLVEQVARELRAIAADHEKEVDLEALQRRGNLLRVEAAAPSLKDRASLHVNLLDKLRCQLDRLVIVRVGQAVVACRDAENVAHAILLPQAVRNTANNGIQPWAQTTASDQCSLHCGWVPPDVLACIASHTARRKRWGTRLCLRVVHQDVPNNLLVRVQKIHAFVLDRHGAQDLVDGSLIKHGIVPIPPCGKVVEGEISRGGKVGLCFLCLRICSRRLALRHFGLRFALWIWTSLLLGA
mmetsp:Transcript_50328/g.109079  ORF Transcript_50328/g.109079 Transcript_50328/m.109079 type:complete len:504 (+) Transcript_50328:454-1965(+)